MTKYTITIELQSYLLTGSGEGNALIDTEVVFHPLGFPFIPGRRIKGLLKESFQETMEILGKPDSEITGKIENIFGKSGTDEEDGIIRVPNFYLAGWENLKANTKKLRYKYKHAFQPDNIKVFFTAEIQQTAIDGITGTAKERSLRNYRVLKPFGHNRFVGQISFNKVLNADEKKLLEYAFLNLRAAGTRRNRGFGKILCKVNEITITDSTNQQSTTPDNGTITPYSRTTIPVKLTTKSPIVLALQLGEQNTVFTESFISGNRLRGMLAGLYIKRKGLGEQAHTDPDFCNLFLSGKVKFGNLYVNGVLPVPLYIHKFKGYSTSEKLPVDVFVEKQGDNKNYITKPVGGYATLKNEGSNVTICKDSPSTSFFFHNSRPNRSAGRSVKDQPEGGIFYYEALDEDQEFIGEISSDDSRLLGILYQFLENGLHLSMGRSQSAQYGHIHLKAEPPGIESNDNNKNIDNITNGTYLVIARSPIVLFNKFGLPAPNEQTLLEALKTSITGATIEFSKDQYQFSESVTTFTTIEQYNSVWRSKAGKYLAFKEGSTFKINISGLDGAATTAPEYLGEWREQGFGSIDWEEYQLNQTFSITNNENNKDNNTEKTGPEGILQYIQNDYAKQQNETAIKQAAIQKAVMHNKRPTNHLTGRMLDMIKAAPKNDSNYIDQWFTDIQGKPAEESLKSTELFEDLKKFVVKAAGNDFEKSRLYWRTFFQTLRKLNSKNEQR